uniref:N-acetyltransferase domain-containing protein n=1 Tax=Kalanchoe fedtschenkoi TaxID=63787 RepID=A0A7N0ZYU1_KALFE
MATALRPSFSLNPQFPHHRHNRHRRQSANLSFNFRHPLPFSPSPIKPHLPPLRHSSLPCTQSQTSTSTPTYLDDDDSPIIPGRFLTGEELDQLNTIQNFSYHRELPHGSMWVRAMKPGEMNAISGLLAESFADSMMLSSAYVTLLRFLVKQYLSERAGLVPHTATLIGFYKDRDAEVGELAGTVEVSFDERGANVSPPTPPAPKDSPYICNMTVKKQMRRRGIGWHLLKASEDLIAKMSTSRDVYLHCRMIDKAPFNMYTKAGYSVVKTDSILVLLMLQRRKYLMRKKLPASIRPTDAENESNFTTSENEDSRAPSLPL